ncbi:MAG: serine hydrolase [Saprospiraceae bacterium]|nr:serine hydrolase [Saprospiraceae bacterium]
MKAYKFIFLIVLMTGTMFITSAQKMVFPEKQWLKYENAADAGFSKNGLDSLYQQLNQGSAAFVVEINGKIVVDWGETSRRFILTSARKSLMSAMIGIYVGKGKINPNSTLAELGIDDIQPLTEIEKQARVIDLMAARSGIYLPSAYAPQGMINNLPTRGSAKPGEQWFYNNWDFNTLSTIFNQQSGKDFFEAFQDEIAKPLQMEDFRLFDTFYRYEQDKSKHPAYLFRLSARDLARFGHLYLNEGKWKGKQIIPKDWVAKSTSAYTKDTDRFQNFGSYGLLWWTMEIDGVKTFYASGAGGQRVYIIPELDMVIAHLSNNYQESRLGEEEVNDLVKLLLKAKVGKQNKKAKLAKQTAPIKAIPAVKLDMQLAAQIQGTYQHPRVGIMKIKLQNEKLILEAGIGNFHLLPTSNDTFFVEDIEMTATFKPGSAEQKSKIENVFNSKRQIEKLIFYY